MRKHKAILNRRTIFQSSLIVPLLAVLLSCGGGPEYTHFRVYPAAKTVKARPGAPAFIALKVEIPKGEYLYGNPKGPGIGNPAVVTVEAPGRIEFAPARYLPAKKHLSDYEPGLYNWVYFNETTLFLPFTVKKESAPGTVTAKVHFSGQSCSTFCVKRDADLEIAIEILPGGSPLPAEDGDLAGLYETSRPGGDAAVIDTAEPAQPGGTGVLDDISFEPVSLDTGVTGLLQAILLGMLAGFILNFMPCVLPVVGLKVMGFVRMAGASGRQLKVLGALFSLGILASFGVLASLAAFLGYSWGGLFQSRVFIIAMAAVVFALALSMLGVFTLNIPSFAGKAARSRENPYADAFLKGMLATLLATPCSGPFLGGTLAWAMSQPPAVIFAIFMSVGTGMALPYLVLTLNRRLLSFIPKPGEWTVIFERLMGFFLVFTAAYLVSLLKTDYIVPMIFFLCFVALGFWQFGVYGSVERKRSTRAISFILLLVIIGSGYSLVFPDRSPTAAAQREEHAPYSVERLLANRDNGKISMVIFTADWCINCRMVESTALSGDAVLKAIREKGVDLMKADLSEANPAATELMKKTGNLGGAIPYLVIFPAGDRFTRPLCLSGVYTQGSVLEALERAGSDK